MSTYKKHLLIEMEFTATEEVHAERGVLRLKVESVVFGDYKLTAVSDLDLEDLDKGPGGRATAIELEKLALEAEIADKISNVAPNG